jgi:peptidoglycan/LPS O-acetylase OafA/YrhL
LVATERIADKGPRQTAIFQYPADVSRPAEAHGLRYAPGLDGIRALAVFAVVAYHIGTTSNATVLPGGFLGVDLFFVLSGYLITSLLIIEVKRTGRISIKQFYIRRARRLLPALFAMLLVVGAIGAFWLPQQATRLRGDLLAALGYVTNWWLIAQNSSYFDTEGDRPALLTHLWSLAVEEQYYLIWPLILIVFAVLRAKRWIILIMVLGGVAASTVAAAMMYDPFSDPSRVYYGTDTRALAPLLGGALALAVQPWKHRRRLARWTRHGLDTLGIVALLTLAAIAAILHDTDPALFGLGFLVIAVLGAIVVGVAGHPGTALGEMLGMQPLRWLGERSYAIYLWHWPVCVLTRPGVDVPVTGWANAALRIAIAVLLADLSYRLIETPIRRNGFLAPLRARADTPRARAPIFRTAVLTLAMIAGGTAVGMSLSSASSAPAAGGPVDVAPDATLGPLPGSTPTATATSGPTPTATTPRPAGTKVVFFGDSQAMTLLINRPADLGRYINAIDASIEGCGVLVGKVESRSGERRNMANACTNWKSQWENRVARYHPAIAVIMIGAWDVFDLTLDSGKLTFGTSEWDTHFTESLTAGIDILRAGNAEVALSLLPCYRPLRKSAGFWPERGDDDRTRHVNDLMTAAAAAYPGGVHTIDPPKAFCTTPTIGNNTAYRWDGIHYYKKGAALYFRDVLPQILKL